ncbi:MAG: DUF481 domain-containing protein [Candidatus Sulfopaludibacter sp.]|nr:DUF481 domain-containing protein [Candidatus Sulfopaludibacter sp.]
MSVRNVLLLLPLCLGLRGQTPAAAPKPEPDVLIFANGEKLVGHLVASHGGTLTFKSDSLGDLTIDWKKVQELHASETFVVIHKNVELNRKSDLSKLPTGTVSMTDQKITVTPAAGAPETMPVADAAHLVDQPAFERVVLHSPGFFDAWNGAVMAGATLVEATQQSRTFTGAFNLVRAIPTANWLAARNRTSIDFSASDGFLSQPGSPSIKTDIIHGDIERDEYFSSKNVFAFGRAAFDHNYSQGLDLQQNYGGGIGWTAIKRADTTLDIKGSLSYTRQQFAPPANCASPCTVNDSHNLVGAVLAQDYTHKFAKGIQFLEQISVIPAFNEPSAYAATANAGLNVPVYKRLSFSISTADSFLNNPPPGFKKNSFQLTTGLTYTLK